MGFKIKNFYQKPSPLRQQKISPLRQHEEGHGYEPQANPTEAKKVYGGPDGKTVLGTLWTDGTYVKSAYTLQKESDDTPKFSEVGNEFMTPQNEDDVDYTWGGDNFSEDGEGTEWFYAPSGQKLPLEDEETVNNEFQRLNDETDKYLNRGKYAPGYSEKDEAMKQRLIDLGMDPNLDVSGSRPKNTSKVKWSEAPGVGTDERRDWYIKNNLKLDHTTPEQVEQVKEPVVDEIVNEEETEVIAEERKPLNRRQRRAFNIEAKNDARRLKRMGTSEEEIKEGVKNNSFVIPEGDFQDPNIA